MRGVSIRGLFVVVWLLAGGACGPSQPELVEARAGALLDTGGAITFYMPYDGTAPTPAIAGGSSTPTTSDQIIPAPAGLFGGAASSQTAAIAWPKAGNIDLSHPGMAAFWVKPDHVTGVEWLFTVIDGSRKMFVYTHDGAIWNRMENWGTPQGDEVSGGSIASWATDAGSAQWHLVVASWGPDSIGLSVDGASPSNLSLPWLPGVATGGGWLYGGGDSLPGYAIDELMVFNRVLWDSEIQWLWGTRVSPSSPNPAVARFNVSTGAITFYMDYESLNPVLFGGSPTPTSGDPLVQGPGLFGQFSAKSDTNYIAWPKAGNINLSRPGSAAFWLKATQPLIGAFPLTVIDGSRKLLVEVYPNGDGVSGTLQAYIEKWNTSQTAAVPWGSTKGWGTTDTSWHLIVVSWGWDYIGFSVDGAPTVTTGAGWLPALPESTGGWLYAGGNGYPGYLLDELVVVNRPLGDDEIAWIWGTRKTPVTPNPIRSQLASGDDSARRVVTHYGYLPSSKTMQVEVDLRAMPSLAALTGVQLAVRSGAGATVASTTMPPVQNGLTSLDWVLPATLAPGTYNLIVTLAGMPAVPPLSYPFTRAPVGSWEGNTLGLSNVVVPPFTPIRVTSSVTVGTIGRSHVMGTSGLWTSASAGAQQLLASRMRLEAVSGSTRTSATGTLTSTPPNGSWTSASYKASWSISSAGLSGTTSAVWDYDGTMKTTLTLSPTSSTVDGLDLVIPLASGAAPLMHVVGDSLRVNYAGATPLGPSCSPGTTQTITLWDARNGGTVGGRQVGAVANQVLMGSFVPYLWLGSPNAGIAVFADNDKGWTPSTTIASHELVRVCNAGGTSTLELRLHLIASPTRITSPQKIVLGLQLTPVKPMPSNWRLWTVGTPDSHPQPGSYFQGFLGSGYGRGAVETAEEFYPRGQDFSLYTNLVSTAASHAVTSAMQSWIDNTWLPGYAAYGVTAAELPKYANEINAAFSLAAGTHDGILSYTNPRGARFDLPEGQTFLNEWITRYLPTRIWPLRSGTEQEIDQVASYRDYLIYYYDKILTSYGDGIYLDDMYLAPTYNTSLSDAYRRPDGAIQPAATLWDTRALVRRLAVHQSAGLGHPNRTLLHMTNTAVAPVLAFSATQADWEINDENDYQDRFSREYIQTESIGLQAGTVPFVVQLTSGVPATAARQLRTAAGVMLTHELKPWDPNADFWNNRDSLVTFGYGASATTVWNYWQANYPATITGGATSSIVVSRPGHAIVVVCDWQGAASNPYTMTLNAGTLGLGSTITVVDLEGKQQPQVGAGNQITFTLPRHDFVVLRIDGAP